MTKTVKDYKTAKLLCMCLRAKGFKAKVKKKRGVMVVRYK